MSRETIINLFQIVVAIIIIVVVVFFGVKQIAYCLQTTGQLQCVIVAPQPTKGAQ